MTEHNLKILDTVITKVCNRWKADTLKEDHRLHLINYSDEGFSNLLDWDIISDLKNNPEYEGIFTEDNIRFFREQLERHPDGYYTGLLPRNECYMMKNELEQKEQIPPPIHWPQDYYMSKVVFTEDFEYGLFVSGQTAIGIGIYKFVNGHFEPYKSISLYIE